MSNHTPKTAHGFRFCVALLLTLIALDLVPSGTARAQGLTDTDSDGMDDAWEVTYFGNLAATSTGDSDADGMTNGEEYLNGFVPNVDDAFADVDGDRYPNVFEVRGGSNPNGSSSVPTPTYVVNGADGGTHTTVNAALTAATVANGAYQIIGIAPGVYPLAGNANFAIASTKPKLLFIGLEGAADTVIDCGANQGWVIQNSAVIASLTFRNAYVALRVQSPAKEVRFVDLIVRDNTSTSEAGLTAGLHVTSLASGGKVYVVGSTFLDNGGLTTVKQINVLAGTATIANTVVWSQTTGTMVQKGPSATLFVNNSLVKGQTFAGTGNLAGTVDPKVRADGRPRWDSLLRAAGGTFAQSRIDLDGELRPSITPDIGVDQFNDTDGDELADQWELDYAGNLTTLNSRAQDAEGDGLSNEADYAAGTNPMVGDTDGDGTSDGDEVLVHATDPLKTDTDRDGMPDGWEIEHGLDPLVVNIYDDDDGDRYPNIFEYTYSADPGDPDSIPTPTLVVDRNGGGTHTTVGAAVGAALASAGAYQIIGIKPGVYTGSSNLMVSVNSAHAKILFIGLEGAAKTIIDGGGIYFGWQLVNSAVISSLTFRNTLRALSIGSKEVRLVDLIVRDNTATGSDTGGVQVPAGATGIKVYITGSTFFNNTSATTAKQINIGSGVATIVNTVVWGQTSDTMVGKGSGATLTVNNSLVKGQTFSGTGNLAGNIDPKLSLDGHLLWDSPLRGAGGAVLQSCMDMDGELRPYSAPDIGVDQFNDSDGDELADQWELNYTGSLTTLTGRFQNADGDGFSNEDDYLNGTSPVIADTDGDGISDSDEVLVHGSDPLSTDTDRDGMPDGWEITHALAPLVVDVYDDADGDRYPNIYEFAYSTDPSDRASIPTPMYVVNTAGRGTHKTISAALSAATTANGIYQIIGIEEGVYTGVANLSGVLVASTTPRLLIIGLQGAAKTIIDGGGINSGWRLQNTAVISSLTFRNTVGALSVAATGHQVRLVDLIVRDNTATGSAAAGLQVSGTTAGVKVHVLGSTFLNNVGASGNESIYIGSGAATIANTVVWGQTSGTMLAKATGAVLTVNNCLVKGQSFAGAGNLAGSTDPKLLSDAHLRPDSPLRSAGASVPQSRLDMDGELRPSAAPDIGADQYNDMDGDELVDRWEVEYAGELTTLTGRSQDRDGDQLSNEGEFVNGTNPVVPDTDRDGLLDGVELDLGTNPLVFDSDGMTSDTNQDGIIDMLGAQLGYQPNQLDSDGDSIANADEALMGTNPLRTDSDSDGVPDGTDAFPLDPFLSVLPSEPQDVSPPVITLTAPPQAVEQ